MLAIKFAVSYAIPDIPEWVEDEIAKVEYKRREAEKAEKVCFVLKLFIIWLRQMPHADWLITGLEKVILPAQEIHLARS